MKIKETEIGGAILAGGKNSRMLGRNKSFIDIGGMPIIEKTVRLFNAIFDETILVTNSPNDYKEYAGRVIIVGDEIKDAGPMGGVYTGLSKTSKRAVFFVACDMPFLHNGLIRRQLNYFKKKECDCLVPRIGNSAEPLHAIYKKKLKDDIYEFLKDRKNRAIRDFLKTISASYLDLEPSTAHQQAFQNLNTPQDLKRLEGATWK